MCDALLVPKAGCVCRMGSRNACIVHVVQMVGRLGWQATTIILLAAAWAARPKPWATMRVRRLGCRSSNVKRNPSIARLSFDIYVLCADCRIWRGGTIAYVEKILFLRYMSGKSVTMKTVYLHFIFHNIDFGLIPQWSCLNRAFVCMYHKGLSSIIHTLRGGLGIHNIPTEWFWWCQHFRQIQSTSTIDFCRSSVRHHYTL